MRDLVRGVRLLAAGQRWAVRHGRDWRFGMVPALSPSPGTPLALVALALWAGGLVGWATPFADHWPSPWAGLFRGLLTAVLFGGALLLALMSFTAVTLLVGQPFYESLAARVDRGRGRCARTAGAAAVAGAVDVGPGQPAGADPGGGLRGGAVRGRFLPVVGQTAVPVIGFGVSGFFLALELCAVAFQRRDVPLEVRLRLLRGRLPLVLGFGVPLVLAFLVPLVAVVLMPGAVAGATLLVRELVPPPEPYGAGADDDEAAGSDAGAGRVAGAGQGAAPSVAADGSGGAGGSRRADRRRAGFRRGLADALDGDHGDVVGELGLHVPQQVGLDRFEQALRGARRVHGRGGRRAGRTLPSRSRASITPSV